MRKDIIFGSGLSSYKDFEGLKNVCLAALQNGIVQFDTAPSYKTEALLSKTIRDSAKECGLQRDEYSIQTKIDPIQMYDGNIEEYFKAKLQEMRLDYVDNLLIHWPVKKYLHKSWEAILNLKEEGLTKKIGICNLRIRHLEALKSQGIIPEILQIERHPLNTFDKEVAWCHNNGVWLQDYSPLCKMNPRIQKDEKLNIIARNHNKELGQIILRWHLETGATPIFTSRSPERIKLYSQLFDFCLSKDEIDIISRTNCNHKLYLESLVCPGF